VWGGGDLTPSSSKSKSKKTDQRVREEKPFVRNVSKKGGLPKKGQKGGNGGQKKGAFQLGDAKVIVTVMEGILKKKKEKITPLDWAGAANQKSSKKILLKLQKIRVPRGGPVGIIRPEGDTRGRDWGGGVGLPFPKPPWKCFTPEGKKKTLENTL